MDKGRGERPVAVSAGNIVGAKFCGLDVLNQQPQGSAATHDTGSENRTVFVAIAWEEMCHDSLVVAGGHEDVTMYFGSSEVVPGSAAP